MTRQPRGDLKLTVFARMRITQSRDLRGQIPQKHPAACPSTPEPLQGPGMPKGARKHSVSLPLKKTGKMGPSFVPATLQPSLPAGQPASLLV